MRNEVLIIFGVLAVVFIVFAIVLGSLGKRGRDRRDDNDNAESRRAGRSGEIYAEERIKTVLRGNDCLLTNVAISYEGRETELDNVVINNCGVFIIEVKNYNGRLVGKADDFEWKKYKKTQAGNVYERDVKNPIRQVRRQIHLLARYLEANGLKVWVKGYAMLINANSPVKSAYVLEDIEAVDRALHTSSKVVLSDQLIEEISALLLSTGHLSRI